MDTNPSNNSHTPNASVYGGLLIAAGIFTALMALGEKSNTATIIGGVITLAGIVFVMIGSRQKKNSLQLNADEKTVK